LLALVTGNLDFATTALHCLVAGLLFTPLAIATGLFSWWLNYRAKPIRPIRIKIWCSLFMMTMALAILIWRLQVPDILLRPGAGRLAYLLLIFSLVPLITTIGWFGAKLTFPMKKN